MDLFDYMRMERKKQESPLAVRMRPRTLDEVVGQSHIIGKDRLLYRAIQADKISSLIFYGPPGTGKTTLAKVIANTTKCAVCADECHHLREKGHGAGGQSGERYAWNVWQADDSLY